MQRKQIQGEQRQSTQTQRLTKSEIFTQTLKRNIQEGTYPYGTALPAERELAESFGLNRSTVRAAIQTLVEEGLLKKVQGKGTFVMRHARDNAYTHFRGMSELLKNHGYVPSSRILYRSHTSRLQALPSAAGGRRYGVVPYHASASWQRTACIH